MSVGWIAFEARTHLRGFNLRSCNAPLGRNAPPKRGLMCVFRLVAPRAVDFLIRQSIWVRREKKTRWEEARKRPADPKGKTNPKRETRAFAVAQWPRLNYLAEAV